MTTTHENKGQSTSDIVLVILKNVTEVDASLLGMQTYLLIQCVAAEENNLNNNPIDATSYATYIGKAVRYRPGVGQRVLES